MPAPRFEMNATVYLKESANAGFLEKRTVQAIFADSSEWAYGFLSGSNPPTAVPTITDRVNHKLSRQDYCLESELCTYCEALTLCRAQAVRILAKIDSLIAAANCT